MSKKNIIILFFFSALVIILQGASYFIFGLQVTRQLYPFIAHFPLILLLALYYKKRMLSSIYSVISAYLCCQLAKWLAVLASEILGTKYIYDIVEITITVLVFIMIVKYIAPPVALIAKKSSKTILIFGILPATYYVFDYVTTVYSNLLYSGSVAVFEFLPFMLCIAFLLFSAVYFNEYEQKYELSQQKKIIEIQASQTQKQISEIKRTEYEVSLIRHDMRHFMNNVISYLENDETDKAIDYINKTFDVLDNTVIKNFCKNELINMVLSSYNGRLRSSGINFIATVDIPEDLPYADTSLTSILSNALENAMNAVSQLDDCKKYIILKMVMSGGKLLISIKNPYDQEPEMMDGIPISRKEGHGLGTQSIKYVANKLGGNCRFIVKDGIFMLQVVI